MNLQGIPRVAPIAMAAGHPQEELVVTFIERHMTCDFAVTITHRPTGTRLVIDCVTVPPYSLDSDDLGELFKYLQTPGKTVEITYTTAIHTIEFLKETI